MGQVTPNKFLKIPLNVKVLPLLKLRVRYKKQGIIFSLISQKGRRELLFKKDGGGGGGGSLLLGRYKCSLILRRQSKIVSIFELIKQKLNTTIM